MIRVVVAGALGRMGQRIIEAIRDTGGVTLVGGTELPEHRKCGVEIEFEKDGVKSAVKITGKIEDVLDKSDVVIDFTRPLATMQNLKIAQELGKAVVIGTTGFDERQKKTIEEAGKNIPIVISPNMSIGVNLLFELTAKAARILQDEYDVEIYEAHHRNKVDAPSGTAVRLAEILADELGRNLGETGIYGRKGIVGERSREEIGIHSIRGGDIVGDHTVLFAGMGERVELIHRAHTRDTFARGAVRAAIFVAGKDPGVYSMRDVLGF